MNVLVEECGFLVVYFVQVVNVNGLKCWNWFCLEDQSWDWGEFLLIVGIMCEIVVKYYVDECWVFVVGLLLGVVMVVIFGMVYLDFYVVVGVYFGLFYGVVYDMVFVFGVMKGGGGLFGMFGWLVVRVYQVWLVCGVLIIVFYGDCDVMVDF